MKGLLVIAFVALLAVKGESFSWSDCSCGTCPPGCVPTKQRFYMGGRDVCYCYCKCSSSPQPPAGHPPPADQKPHQPPPPPPTTCQCPSPPKESVPTPPPRQSPQPRTPPSQQQCQWWLSRIDPGCDTFAKLIPTMPSGPGDVKFILGTSCCEAIANARQCYPNLYAGLDLQRNCYH